MSRLVSPSAGDLTAWTGHGHRPLWASCPALREGVRLDVCEVSSHLDLVGRWCHLVVRSLCSGLGQTWVWIQL